MTVRAHKIAIVVAFGLFVAWFCFVTLRSFDYYSYHYISNHYGDQQKHDSNDEHDRIWGHADPGVTFVTLLLVIVGGVQIAVFLQQLKLIRESLTPAQDAANAAKLAATTARDEFLSTHRPKIRIKHVVLTSKIVYPDDLGKEIQITASITIINEGVASAFLHEFGVKFIVEQKRYFLPPVDKFAPAKTNLDGFLPKEGLPSGMSTTLENVSDGTSITSQRGFQIGKGDWNLYCVGYFHYFDSAKRIRTTAFCRVLVFPPNTVSYVDTGRFRMMDPKDPDYEYES
jgi:hypothetical protein